MKTKQKQESVYLQIGLIIGQVNVIELKIDDLIAKYYVKPEKANEFIKEFLFSDRLSLYAKLGIFKEIVSSLGFDVDKKLKNDIENWRRIRNIVAHGVPGTGKDNAVVVLFNGKTFIIDDEFKKFGKSHDRLIDLLDEMERKLSK